MKILIIGGHLSPALSVIDSIPKDWKVLFAGRKYVFEGEKSLSLEYKTINSLNIPFEEISTGRLQRKFSKNTISSLLKLPLGFLKAAAILRKFKPDVILGFGGYLQVPIVIASFFLKIPVVLHEQTLESGFANKICSSIARKICISWESSFKFFPKKKTVLTGNPIRKEIVEDSSSGFKTEKSNSGLPIIYVTGGSSGSHFINILIEDLIQKLLINFKVIHQTGDSHIYNDYDRFYNLYTKLPKEFKKNYSLHKFINPSEIGKILKKAEFAVSRSGINTITEFIYTKKPAILIPLPFSQNNEQFKNALFLEKLGLAKIILQKEATAQVLLSAINSMHESIDGYRKNSANLKNLIKEDAADKIIEIVKKCVLKN